MLTEWAASFTRLWTWIAKPTLQVTPCTSGQLWCSEHTCGNWNWPHRSKTQWDLRNVWAVSVFYQKRSSIAGDISVSKKVLPIDRNHVSLQVEECQICLFLPCRKITVFYKKIRAMIQRWTSGKIYIIYLKPKSLISKGRLKEEKRTRIVSTHLKK